MKIKVSKHKFNIHYRGSLWGSRTQQHTYCLRYAHSQHIESHLSENQPQTKIPVAFLFSRLHFNRVTSNALFYGGHLVMHSKRCAMQNQWITLNVLCRVNAQDMQYDMYYTSTSFLTFQSIYFVTFTLPVSPQKFKREGVECNLIIHVMIQRQHDEVKHGFSLVTQTGQKSIISIINNNTHLLI